jgi:hypothetical protein
MTSDSIYSFRGSLGKLVVVAPGLETYFFLTLSVVILSAWYGKNVRIHFLLETERTKRFESGKTLIFALELKTTLHYLIMEVGK